jgi:polysaccharide export outer membrane protein
MHRLIAPFAFLLLLLAPPNSFAQAEKPAGTASGRTNYMLKANDEILVRVFREPDLDGTRRISKDGTIDFPLLGIVSVAGKTPYEAAAHLAALLDKDYIIRPQVFVNVQTTSKRRFNVLGQVASPGTKDIPEDRELDILSAIAAAGGFTRIANQSNVIVRRQEGDGDQTFKVDVKRLMKDKDMKPFIVHANDTIIVEERFF